MIKHVFSMWQFGRNELEEMIASIKDILEKMLTEPKARTADLSKDITILMAEKSTRTMSSFAKAAKRLGYIPATLAGETTSLGKGETLYRTAKMFSLYDDDMLITRSPVEGVQKFIAEKMEQRDIPCIIFNAGDGSNEHPTQALLDLSTIMIKKGRIDGLKIAMVGDLKRGRVPHSDAIGLSRFKDVTLYLLSDKDTELPLQYQRLFKKVVKAKSLEDLHDCDVVMHFRLQEERFAGNIVGLRRAQKNLQINAKNIRGFKADCIFMHPQPYTSDYAPNLPEEDRRIVIDFQARVGLATRIYLIREALKNQHEPMSVFPPKKIRRQIVKRVPIEEYRADATRNKSNKQNLFVPITTEGVIIDHLPEGFGQQVLEFLLKNGIKRRESRLVEGARSTRHGTKDIILLEKGFVSEELMMSISLFAPQTTFYLIGDHFTKMKIVSPRMAVGLGKCPNDDCVTNQSAGECNTRFSKFNGSKNLFQCGYCQSIFTKEEILNKNR